MQIKKLYIWKYLIALKYIPMLNIPWIGSMIQQIG